MFRRLAVRNAVRRRNEALLIVLGSLFGTAIATTAFVVGDSLQVFVFGQTSRFVVRGMVPRLGVAGFHPGFVDRAENVFVAPGTLDALAGKAPRTVLGPEGRVLVSLTGGVFDSAARSDSVG